MPRLQLGAAFLDGGWRTAELERCAARFDVEHGVALRGGRKSPGSVRAIISDTDALFVDVTEPADAKPGALLQVCFAPFSSRIYDYCSTGTLRPECVRIGLDGRVLSGRAEVQRAPDRPRFRVQLPPEQSALTITYIEANGRSLSSSPYRTQDATSLGDVFAFEPGAASCRLSEGSLQFAFTPLPTDGVLLDSRGWE